MKQLIFGLFLVLAYPMQVLGYSISDTYKPYGHTENLYYITNIPSLNNYIEVDGGRNSSTDEFGYFTVTPDAGDSGNALATISITEYLTTDSYMSFSNVKEFDAVVRPNTPIPTTRNFTVPVGERFEFEWAFAVSGPNSLLYYMPYLARPGETEEISFRVGDEPGLLVALDATLWGSAEVHLVNQYNAAFEIVSIQPLPEPATMFLFGAGIVVLTGTRLRKNKR